MRGVEKIKILSHKIVPSAQDNLSVREKYRVNRNDIVAYPRLLSIQKWV